MPKIEVVPPGPAPIRRANSPGPEAECSGQRLRWLVVCAVLGTLIGAGAGIGQLVLGDVGVPAAPERPAVSVTDPLLAPLREASLVYPHSVVPGGVHEPGEAMSAVDRDPVVADHYRGIQLAALRAAPVDAPRAVHVSYRLGDRIYWTKRKVMLHPGELLLTDGSRAIRARCGNCVSDVARGPVSDQEPAPEVFDRPVPTAGATPGGGIAPLRAYDLLASAGLMPPALSGSAFGGTSSFGGAGVPGLGGGPTGGFSGGFPGGFTAGGGGAPGGTTDTNRTTGTDSPRGEALPPFDGSPPTPGEGLFEPPPSGGGTPPPPGGGTPPVPSGGTPPPPGGGTLGPPPGGGDMPSPPGGGTFGLPPGGGTPPPPGGGTLGPPPGGGTLVPPTEPDGDGGTPDSPAPVPEPSALLLLASGISALAVRRLRGR